MRPPRLYRVIAAFVALICMLTMQFAVTAYVCPGMAGGGIVTASLSASGHPGMTRCEDMDMAQPGLCHAQAHDEASKQSLDRPDSPNIAAYVPVGLGLVVIANDSTDSPIFPPVAQVLARATAPPIAIRHCCFRI